MKMKFFSLISLFIFLLLIEISFEGTKKEVDDLFNGLYDKEVYSGYLNTLIEGNELFYIYYPSQGSQSTDPLLLWLNGGPGCSSLYGMLGEIGPVVTDNFSGKLIRNEYSWNLNANVLFIEQPAGVGFSKTSDPKHNWTETDVAENLMAGIKDFIILFPEFKGREFYVSGESYAGVYIPNLVKAILYDTSIDQLNFQGFIIANAYTDFVADDRSLIEFGYWRGLISQELYDTFQRNCPHYRDELNPKNATYGIGDMENHLVTHKCNDINAQLSESLSGSDWYGIYRVCPSESRMSSTPFYLNRHHTMKKHIMKNLRRFKTKNKNGKFSSNSSYFEPENAFWPKMCGDDLTYDTFLNMNSTKEKLGIANLSLVWMQCASLNYVMEESVDFYNTTMKEFPYIKFWLFSGTEDGCVPTLGTIRWIDQFHFNIESKWSQWKLDEQVAGYDQKYEEGLILVTVKGAGHMVPQDKRKESKFVFDSFLKGVLPSQNK